MPLDAPASHSAESPAQPSRAEQLGAFLRRRRESIEPQRVGISCSAADARRACVARRWRSSPGSA